LFERRLQTELVEKRREKAMRLLKNISDGTLNINSKSPNKGAVSYIRTSKKESIFDKRFRLV
jgi:hypothetical protein